MRDYEPRPMRGEWMYSAPGYHSYPPRRPRWPAPRKQCPHCGLPSETHSKTCPVCGAYFEPSRLRRLLHR